MLRVQVEEKNWAISEEVLYQGVMQRPKSASFLIFRGVKCSAVVNEEHMHIVPGFQDGSVYCGEPWLWCHQWTCLPYRQMNVGRRSGKVYEGLLFGTEPMRTQYEHLSFTMFLHTLDHWKAISYITVITEQRKMA